jgi:glutaredoxin-related protein
MSTVKNIVEKQIAENPVVVYSKSTFSPPLSGGPQC